jgi:hypothetical protein
MPDFGCSHRATLRLWLLVRFPPRLHPDECTLDFDCNHQTARLLVNSQWDRSECTLDFFENHWVVIPYAWHQMLHVYNRKMG